MMCIPPAGGSAPPSQASLGLAAPLPDVEDTLRSNSRPDVVGKARLRDALILSGIPLKSPWMNEIMMTFHPRYRIGLRSVVRRIASLNVNDGVCRAEHLDLGAI